MLGDAAGQRIEPGKECGGIVRANLPLTVSEQACIHGVWGWVLFKLLTRTSIPLANTSANLSFISLSSSPRFFHNSRCPSESMASQHPIVAGSVKFPKPADQAFQYGTAGVSQSALTIDTGRLSVLRSVSHECVSSTTRIS